MTPSHYSVRKSDYLLTSSVKRPLSKVPVVQIISGNKALLTPEHFTSGAMAGICMAMGLLQCVSEDKNEDAMVLAIHQWAERGVPVVLALRSDGEYANLIRSHAIRHPDNVDQPFHRFTNIIPKCFASHAKLIAHPTVKTMIECFVTGHQLSRINSKFLTRR